jgi:hypothetical protein
VGNGTGALAICGSTSRMESSVHPIYCEAASMGKHDVVFGGTRLRSFSRQRGRDGAVPANEEGRELFPPTRREWVCKLPPLLGLCLSYT